MNSVVVGALLAFPCHNPPNQKWLAVNPKFDEPNSHLYDRRAAEVVDWKRAYGDSLGELLQNLFLLERGSFSLVPAGKRFTTYRERSGDLTRSGVVTS